MPALTLTIDATQWFPNEKTELVTVRLKREITQLDEHGHPIQVPQDQIKYDEYDVRWLRPVDSSGVEPELTVLKGGEPEVTHGLTLIPGHDPLPLKGPDGKPIKMAVGDAVTRRAHVNYPDGHSDVVLPGDWIIKNGDAITVLSPKEFAATYPQAK